jgi:fumarylacetoacetase
VTSPDGGGFGLDHLPYGVFSVDGGPRRVGVRYGDAVLDLAFETGRPELAEPSLNAFLAQGRPVWQEVRAEVVELLADGDAAAGLVPLADVDLHLPFEVADYVDFYASEHHATHVGRLFRPDDDALLPNWKHLPVGYHGRSGTVVASGTPIVRPRGQRGPGDVGPTRRLDLEAELGFVVGVGSTRGEPVAASALADHVFGVVGLNDWSARDLQAWEYVPLGPFLGKSFATSVAHWVTPLDALDAAWCALPGQDPRPADYLDPDGARGLDVAVEVEVDGRVVSRPPYRTTYWGPSQMLAHLTVNGASLRTGDLFGSGTISGPTRDEVGSLLELHEGERFLDDGSVVVLRYSAPGTGGGRITLGEVVGRIEPAVG